MGAGDRNDRLEEQGIDGEVEEARADHEARFLARRIPAEAHFVALVQAEHADPAVGRRGALAADVIATNVARRREHTLLTSLDAPVSQLDALLAPGVELGLPAALDGRKRLSEVAVRRTDRPFVYLPLGDSAPVVADLLESERFRLFVERVRQREGMLLVYVPEAVLAYPALSELLDGYVALGQVGTRLASPTRAVELGRLALESATASVLHGAAEADVAPEGEAPDEAADESKWEDTGTPRVRSGGWRRHRARGRFPIGRIGFGGVAVGLALLGWWVLARRAVPDAGREGAGQRTEMAAPGAEPSVEPGPVEIPPERVTEIMEGAPELPYSVLLASFAAGSDAAERLAELRQDREGTYFVAPTPIRGAIYHRVFAGARRDRTEGQRLMETLVSDGRKAEMSEWDLRPARLAFRLGLFGSLEPAEAARQAVEDVGIVAYVLPVLVSRETGMDTAFVLYAGGYESESAARPMAALLEREGLDIELVSRRGESK
jgi:hypothetical protein